jgi:hypothetical protein
MWSEEHQKGILDYSLKRITRNALLKELPFDEHGAVNEVRQQLTAALKHENGDLVEIVLLAARIFNVAESDYTDLLWLLLIKDWHHSHEDIIRLLQNSRDTRVISFIKRAIDLKPRLEYLAHDDYGSYYKKCLWVLQSIGTAEAIAVIHDYTGAQDSALREQALYRLSKL